MTTFSTHGARTRSGRIAVLCAGLAAWGALTYGCSVEDENPGKPRTGSGVDGSVDGSVSPTDTPPGLSPATCEKYGGYTGVKQIAAAIIAEAAQDCRISKPIGDLNPENTAHFANCFEIFMGNAFGCEDNGAKVTYVGGTTKVNERTCRTMADSHKNMNLRNADFLAFTEAVNKALVAKGVSQDDIRALAPAFEGTKNSVVQTNNQPTKNTYCECPNGLYNGQGCVVEAGVDASDGGNDANDGAITDAADSG